MKCIINVSSGIFKVLTDEVYEQDKEFIKQSGYRLMTENEIVEKLGYVPVDGGGDAKQESVLEKLKKAEADYRKAKEENAKLKKQIKTSSKTNQTHSANND